MNLQTGVHGKSCRICDEWKAFEDFTKDNTKSDGHRSECKLCLNNIKKTQRANRNKKRVFTTLIIPDLQAPYQHVDAIEFLKAVKHKYAPDEVVSGGDELDLYCLNDYQRDPDHDNPSGEYYQGRAFMQKLFKIFPKGVGVTSNHVHGRIERKRMSARLHSAWLKDFEEIIGAPKGWKWVNEHVTQNTVIRHGHADGKSAKGNIEKINKQKMFTATKPLSMLCCHHHTELGSTDVHMGQHIVQFGFCGSLIDRNAPAFKYTNKPPALGCMLIRDGRQYPVVMFVDENNRWTGDL